MKSTQQAKTFSAKDIYMTIVKTVVISPPAMD